MKLIDKIRNKSLGLIVPAILLISWEIVTRLGLFPRQLLVPPEEVIFTFLNLLKNGELVVHLRISLLRVMTGFLFGGSLGFVLGVAMGLSKNVERYVGTLFHSMRQVPTLGWIPFLIILLGLGEISKIIFISIGAFFPLGLNTLNGIKNIPKQYLELAKIFEYDRVNLLRKVILPGALPSIFAGIRLSLGRAWIYVVGAELLASSEGIGYLMTWGRTLFRLEIVILGVIIIGIIGWLFNYGIGLLETYFLRWRPTFNG